MAVTIVPEGVADAIRQQKPGRERWIADRALARELDIRERWHEAQRPAQALHPDRARSSSRAGATISTTTRPARSSTRLAVQDLGDDLDPAPALCA